MDVILPAYLNMVGFALFLDQFVTQYVGTI